MPKALEARGREGGREEVAGEREGGGGERRERDGHRGEYRQHRRIYTRWLEARDLPSRRAKASVEVRGLPSRRAKLCLCLSLTQTLSHTERRRYRNRCAYSQTHYKERC